MRKVLTAIAAAFLLTAALVLVKNEYARCLPGGEYGMKPLLEAGHTEHLFLGSSLFRQGMDIGVLEEELGESVYVLSYNGNQPILMAKELSYLLEQGATFDRVYVDLYAFTAAADPWISDTKILLDTDLGFKKGIWKLMKENNDTDLGDWFEFYVSSNNEQLLTWPVHTKLLSGQFRKGGSILYPAGTTKEALDYSLGTRDGLNDAQTEGFREIIRLCEENAIDLTFVETPKYVSMLEDETYRFLTEGLYDAVSGEQVICADAFTVDTTDPANFQDLLHLSGDGRVETTRQLCGILKNR